MRAVWADVTHEGVVQGGSTITQQFVKNAINGNAPTLTRKLKEAALAWKLEQVWTKDEILTAYLNTIYFGNHAYGVDEASRVYFGHSAKQVNPAEAALLAGIPENPSLYDPVAHPQAARERRNLVLQQMYQQHYLDRDQLRQWLGAPMPNPSSVRLPSTQSDAAPYFANYVTDQLVSHYGPRQVYGGGLKVTTTIDLGLQKLARQAIDKALPASIGPSAALVAIDVHTGNVVAMVGGRNYHKSEFNLATQGERQPGSAFKPFVLAAALKDGISPGVDARLAPGRDRCGRSGLERDELRAHEPRPDRPVEGDRVLRQHRLRAAHEPRRPRERRPRRRARWGSRRSSTRTSRSASAPSRRRRSRWPAPTRRSPTAATGSTGRSSATSRSRSRASPSRRRGSRRLSSTTPRRRRSAGSRMGTPGSRTRCSGASSSTGPGRPPNCPARRSPARRARRRTTAMPGSSASRRTS